MNSVAAQATSREPRPAELPCALLLGGRSAISAAASVPQRRWGCGACRPAPAARVHSRGLAPSLLQARVQVLIPTPRAREIKWNQSNEHPTCNNAFRQRHAPGLTRHAAVGASASGGPLSQLRPLILLRLPLLSFLRLWRLCGSPAAAAACRPVDCRVCLRLRLCHGRRRRRHCPQGRRGRAARPRLHKLACRLLVAQHAAPIQHQAQHQQQARYQLHSVEGGGRVGGSLG